MNRLLCVLPLVALLSSIPASANGIIFNNLSANFLVNPNDGSGDNIGGRLTGPGVNLVVGGGTPFFWFNSNGGFAPGSGGGGPVTIFFTNAFGTLGGHTYADGDLSLDLGSINAASFTFPANGQGFTINLAASLGSITGTIVSSCTQTCQTFSLGSTPGTLTLSFFYSLDTGLYYGSSGLFNSTAVATPEPTTLGLVGIDIGGVVWRRRSQRRT